MGYAVGLSAWNLLVTGKSVHVNNLVCGLKWQPPTSYQKNTGLILPKQTKMLGNVLLSEVSTEATLTQLSIKETSTSQGTRNFFFNV